MRYEAEIKKMFEDVLREDWMTDNDWHYIKTEMERNPKFNLEQFEKDIDVGIENGYSFENQLQLCRDILKKMKDNF